MKRMGMRAAALAAVVSLAACAPADEPGRAGTTETQTGELADARGDRSDMEEFVQRAVEKNMAEIELGRLAQERATDPQVREFAQMMVDDHTKSLSELRQTAQQENIVFTERISDDSRELQERLQGLSGRDFDREYMSAMVDAHEEMHDLLDDRADRTDQRAAADQVDGREPVGTTGETVTARTGAAIDRWAAAALPGVERHHQRAEELHDRLDELGPGR